MSEKINTPSIVWQKWQDPLSIEEPTHVGPEDFIPSFLNDNDDNEPIEADNEQNETEHNSLYSKHIKAIVTPLGIIPYNELSSIGNIFNFWIGHTNFNLSNKIVAIIENTDGVETLDIFTRYRFRIGIGQLFHPGDVMSNISTDLYHYLDNHG